MSHAHSGGPVRARPLVVALFAAFAVSAGQAIASESNRAFRIVGAAPFCKATILEGPNPRGASSSAPQGDNIILIDPTVMAGLPYLRDFVLAHECGHHELGHTTPRGLLREGAEFQRKELDADCWAAKRLAQAGKLQTVYDQIARFEAQTSARPGPRYPTWADRVAKLRDCAKGLDQPAPLYD